MFLCFFGIHFIYQMFYNYIGLDYAVCAIFPIGKGESILKSIFLCKKCFLDSVYPEYIREALRKEAGLDETILIEDSGDYVNYIDYLKDVDFVFSTWSFPGITDEHMQYFPKLKCVFYAAGTVREFAAPILKSKRKLFSAWGANAIPVAEFTISQILLANKGYFLSARKMRNGNYLETQSFSDIYCGNYKCKIGIIGAGMIGKMVIKDMAQRGFNVLVYDPFLSDDQAEKLGAEKSGLTEMFSDCNVISNHIANNEQTRGMFTYDLFSLMKDNATFINTGRGAQVVESDLIRALKEKPDRTALLDVTYPEPPKKNSELYTLENVFLTPHIAGSKANEHWRLSEYMLEEFRHYIKGEPLNYEVTDEVFERMA